MTRADFAAEATRNSPEPQACVDRLRFFIGAQIERDPHPRAGPLLRPVRQLPLGNDRRRSLTFADACSAAGEAQESEHGGHC